MKFNEINFGDSKLKFIFIKAFFLQFNFVCKRFLQDLIKEEDLDDTSINHQLEQSRLDAIQRSFIDINSKFNQVSFTLIDILRAYDSNGYFQKIPTSLERNFIFYANSSCEYTQKVYDARCRSWYLNSQSSYGIIFDPSQTYNTTQTSYYGTAICSQILDREKGFQGAVCGRLNLLQFNDIMYNVSTSSSIFFTIHRDSKEVTLFFKNNRTFSQFNINDPVKNPFYKLVPENYKELIKNLQQNYSTYNFASDQNLIVTELNDGYTAIVSPITIIDKIYSGNYISSQILKGQIPLSEQYRYFDITTPKILNNPLFIFQVLSKSEVLKSYYVLTDFIEKLQITFIILLAISAIIGTVLLYRYSKKISYRLHSPLDKFLTLFQSIKAQDLLYAEIFQDKDSKSQNEGDHSSQHGSSFSYYGQSILAEETDDSLEHFLTSKDTITLYNSFRSMFQMVRYSNYDYYQINYGKSLLQWIKACNFFKKHNDKRAIGICYMNIGNIHFNSERFSEALEAYEQAIIMANYELGFYDETVDKNTKQRSSKDENQNFLQQIQKKEIKKLRFDRKWSYSKALQRYCMYSINSQCWQDYIKVMKSLVKTAKRLKLTNTIKAILLVDLSFGKMMFNQIKQASQLITKTNLLIKQINVNQYNQSAINLHTLSNPRTPQSYVINNRKSSGQIPLAASVYKRQSSMKNINKQIGPNQMLMNETSSQAIQQSNQVSRQLINNQFMKSKKIIDIIRDKIVKFKQKALSKVSSKLFNSNKNQEQNSTRIQNYLAFPSSYNTQSIQTKNQLNNLIEQEPKMSNNANRSVHYIQSSEQIFENTNVQSDYKLQKKSRNSFFSLEQENVAKQKQDVNQTSLFKSAHNQQIPQQQGDISSIGNINIQKNNQDSFRNQIISLRETMAFASQNQLLSSTGRHDFQKIQQSNPPVNNPKKKFEKKTSIMDQRQHNEESIKIQGHDNTFNFSHTNFQIKSDQVFVEKDASAQEDSLHRITQQNNNAHKSNTQINEAAEPQEQSEQNIMLNDQVNQIYQLVKRDEYEYNIPVDILQSCTAIQEAQLLIQKNYFYDAAEILTQQFEDHQIFLPFFRYQTIKLLDQCFQSQQIISQSFENFKKTINSNIFFDISFIIDIYERKYIEVASDILDLFFEDVTSRKYDKIQIQVITEILEQILAPTNKEDLNFSQIRWIKLQIKIMIEDYRQNFNQRPTLLFSIFCLLEQIISSQSLKQKKEKRSRALGEDIFLYKKYIICITEIELWDDSQVHELLQSILNYNNIELLILDINSANSTPQNNLFEPNNKSIIKLFKNVTHLCSYLSNMRLCTQSYGVPLIVERFQSGFLFSREQNLFRKQNLLCYFYFFHYFQMINRIIFQILFI